MANHQIFFIKAGEYMQLGTTAFGLASPRNGQAERIEQVLLPVIQRVIICLPMFIAAVQNNQHALVIGNRAGDVKDRLALGPQFQLETAAGLVFFGYQSRIYGQPSHEWQHDMDAPA